MLDAMGILDDSFWRAAVYCLLPRVILLSMLPLLLIGLLGGILGYFYWDAALQGTRSLLEAEPPRLSRRQVGLS